jgi:hypothetical protein
MIRGEFLQGVEGLLADQVTLFHPAFNTRGRPHFYKTPLVIKHFNPVTVLDQPDFVENRGNAVT